MANIKANSKVNSKTNNKVGKKVNKKAHYDKWFDTFNKNYSDIAKAEGIKTPGSKKGYYASRRAAAKTTKELGYSEKKAMKIWLDK